jgi:hypothetical protein
MIERFFFHGHGGAMREILDALQGRLLMDVLVPGYIDRWEGPPEFRAVPYQVYLRLDEGYLRMDEIGQFDQLKLSLVDEIALGDVGIDEEDQGEAVLASYEWMLLTYGSVEPRCTRFRYWADERSEPDQAIVKCAEFEVENTDIVFADPTWHFGILVGGADRSRVWQESYFKDAENMRSYTWNRE